MTPLLMPVGRPGSQGRRERRRDARMALAPCRCERRNSFRQAISDEWRRRVARTVLDLDDKLLMKAADILGTSKKVATVNAALADVVKRRRREAFAARVKAGGMTDDGDGSGNAS